MLNACFGILADHSYCFQIIFQTKCSHGTVSAGTSKFCRFVIWKIANMTNWSRLWIGSFALNESCTVNKRPLETNEKNESRLYLPLQMRSTSVLSFTPNALRLNKNKLFWVAIAQGQWNELSEMESIPC